MKTLGLFCVVLVVVMSVAALASQSQTGDAPDIKTVADADAAIHALTLRVAALEARLESPGAGAASGSAAAVPSPVLKVESIETVQPTDEMKAEASALQAEAEQLEQDADTLDANIANISIDNVADSARAGTRRQINTYKSQMGEARRNAKEKRKEADAMLAPRQVLHGWTGKKSVEAISEKDLSSQLRGIGVGSYITADWAMVDMDDNTATVTIRSIKKVEAPAGFVERPSGSKKN